MDLEKQIQKDDIKATVITDPIDGGSVTVFQLTELEKDYDYVGEIKTFSLRLILTIFIELVIAVAFLYTRKKELLFILVVNGITQVFLNGLLNLVGLKIGVFIAIIFYILFELLVTLIEGITYSIKFKDKGVLRAFSYAVIANVASFMIGFLLFK